MSIYWLYIGTVASAAAPWCPLPLLPGVVIYTPPHRIAQVLLNALNDSYTGLLVSFIIVLNMHQVICLIS